MNRKLIFVAAAALVLCLVRAAVPPVEQLLPADTLGFISVPDWDKAAGYYKESPYGQLWQDPVLKPFKDNLAGQFKEDFLLPLEKQLGIKFGDYADLVHGQLAIAFIPGAAEGDAGKTFGFLFLADAKEKSEKLKTQLADLKKRWVDANQQVKAEKIREIEFTTIILNAEDWEKFRRSVFSNPDENDDPPKDSASDKAPKKIEITIGQSQSLLIIANNPKDIEKVLARQAGGLVAPLAEQTSYQAIHSALFREALVFGWVNFKPVYDLLLRRMSEPGASGKQPGPFALQMDKVLPAIGLGGLKTVAFKLSATAEGAYVEAFVGVPEANRQGLFQIVAPLPKEAAPPTFVQADVVKYNRWRLDAQKAWTSLETMLSSISPQIAGMLQLSLEAIGKDKDPNFDFKKNLIGGLGDDFMTIQKVPRSSATIDLESPPTLHLIGSPNAEQLAHALKATSSLMPVPPSAGGLQEREFLGRKVYSMLLPPTAEGPDAKPEPHSLHFAAGGGYLALTSDVAMLEEFLRSSDGTGKTLRDLPGLREAAEKVGGLSTGLFGFENQTETMRANLEILKKDSEAFQKLLQLTSGGVKPDAEDPQKMKDWFDFSLLPSFDKVSKYFYFSVYAGSSNPDGI
ncbi:MAG: hypothetical protein HY674_23210, partial [Chloroflexi bacterium]|nr:hypothetical protein [Chloroflexota bacterium]